MGWMQRTHQIRTIVQHGVPSSNKPLDVKDAHDAIATQHIEHPDDPKSFKPASCSLPDADLPFVPPHVVAKSFESGLLWIVIDDIIYDCGEYLESHPGGPDVLQPFWSSDCSWQFRRFHPKGTLREHGNAFRIGRTSGVPNKFKERPRFVGLRRPGCYE